MSETSTDRAAAAMLDDLVERQFREWLYARSELVGDIPDERRELMREAFRGGMLRGLTFTGVARVLVKPDEPMPSKPAEDD
jgi:hypothetical protein